MQRVLTGLILSLVTGIVIAADAPDAWPRWRGPEFNGVARGDAPLTWSDKDHIAWKVQGPGKGHSSPVIWGDRLFLTTAVPTGSAPAAAPLAPPRLHRRLARAAGEQGMAAAVEPRPSRTGWCWPSAGRPASNFGRRWP